MDSFTTKHSIRPFVCEFVKRSDLDLWSLDLKLARLFTIYFESHDQVWTFYNFLICGQGHTYRRNEEQTDSWELAVMHLPHVAGASIIWVSSADQTPKTLLVLDFALQHAAISKFHAARRTLEAVHSLSPGRCSRTDFLQKSGQTTHCRVSSLSLRHYFWH